MISITSKAIAQSTTLNIVGDDRFASMIQDGLSECYKMMAGKTNSAETIIT